MNMNEEKSTPTLTEEWLDYSDRPFGYRDMDSETAMVCATDPDIRQRISSALRALDFNVIEPTIFKEALKLSRFHTFNVIIVDEDFDTSTDRVNLILNHLEHLSMSIRRKIFVVLISSTFATMDDMNAYNKSVNLIINKEEIAELGLILKKEMAENDYFYHVFKTNLEKYGKI